MRRREQVIRDFVQQWLHKAESGLTSAEMLASGELPDYFTSAFHSQQAAEKLLKAFLVRHQIEFRKTHDLDQLLRLAAQVDSSVRDELASCVWLSPFGVGFRYPGEYPRVDQVSARNAVAEAKQVREAVLKRLASYLSVQES